MGTSAVGGSCLAEVAIARAPKWQVQVLAPSSPSGTPPARHLPRSLTKPPSKVTSLQHSFLASRLHVISLTASGRGHAHAREDRQTSEVDATRIKYARLCIHCCYTWSGELHTTNCSFGPLYPIAKAKCRAPPGTLTLFSHIGWLPVLARIRPEDSSFASRDPHAPLSNSFKSASLQAMRSTSS
jgi:hypothetical protein